MPSFPRFSDWQFGRGAAAPVDDDTIIKEIAAERLAEIVSQEGFAVIDRDLVDVTTVPIKISGTLVLLIVAETGRTLHAFTAYRGTAADLERVNRWNKSKGFSKTYLNDAGDPMLSSDLDLAGGVTERAIAEFLKMFSLSLAAWELEVCV